jgi:hypothetical protein
MPKIRIHSCIILIVAGITLSCNQPNSSGKHYDKIESARWLLGSWENRTAEGIAIEQWKSENDSVFAGNSYFIIGNDTASAESITLEQQGDNLYYVPTVKGQNNDQAVVFVLTISTENRLVFENPKHDFPQKITYHSITEDSLLAEISGTIEGKEKTIPFPMTRVK